MKLILFILLISTTTFASVPNEAHTLDFNIQMIGLSKSKENRIFDATEILHQVVTSPEFKRKIIGHTFQGKKTFANNEGLTNRQIYNKILEGAERLKPEKNNTMDLEIQLFTDMHSTTIGYTRTNSSRVWINTKYFNVLSTEKVSANLMHEWLHKLGFCHDVEDTYRRQYSVPYAIGRIVSQIGRQFR